MKRGEELNSMHEIMSTPHVFVDACVNTRCTKHEVEIEEHGDLNTGNYMSQTTRLFSEETGSIIDRFTWCSTHNECEECKCQRKEVGCFETDALDEEFWEKRETEGPMVVTPTGKSSSNYYKRWKTTEGGSPDFNPVSNTGGRGTREDAMKAINGAEAAPMELDMAQAKRKVKKVKTQ
jgi:hypothetical protein